MPHARGDLPRACFVDAAMPGSLRLTGDATTRAGPAGAGLLAVERQRRDAREVPGSSGRWWSDGVAPAFAGALAVAATFAGSVAFTSSVAIT